MILGVSAIGAIVVLVLQYRIFRIENIEQGNKENKKSAARIAKEKKNSLFDFLGIVKPQALFVISWRIQPVERIITTITNQESSGSGRF